MGETPIAEGLFELADGAPRLIGGRRKRDGITVFPMPAGPEGRLYDPVRLAAEGTLWSFTVQRFRPKSPPYAGADDDRSFRPFALGYVELAGQIIVESRLKVADFADLKIGMPMRMTEVAFPTVADPDTVTYAFEPA